MGIIYETYQRPNLISYTPEWNEDGTEKHIKCDGARYHVISYSSNGMKCSCENCEVNKRGY